MLVTPFKPLTALRRSLTTQKESNLISLLKWKLNKKRWKRQRKLSRKPKKTSRRSTPTIDSKDKCKYKLQTCQTHLSLLNKRINAKNSRIVSRTGQERLKLQKLLTRKQDKLSDKMAVMLIIMKSIKMIIWTEQKV